MKVSLNGGPPIAGWFTLEDPTKMDDEQGYSFDFGNHQMMLIFEANSMRMTPRSLPHGSKVGRLEAMNIKQLLFHSGSNQ